MRLCDRRGLSLLAALLLSGCAETKAWFALGMLCAPLCYLLAAGLLVALRAAWSFRTPTPSARPAVLGAPAIVLLLGSLAILATLPVDAGRKLAGLVADQAWVLIVLLSTTTLVGLLGLIWRLWFAVKPTSSVEGSAVLGTALFYGPGLLLSLQLARADEAINAVFLLFIGVCLYGAAPGLFVGLTLVLEALLRRRVAVAAPAAGGGRPPFGHQP